MRARFPRLEAIFGTELVDLTEEHIGRALGAGVEEAQDLDFKREMYGGSDRDKRDLATDVAAIANANGGLLIIGIDEEDGRAAGSNPVPLTEREAMRLESIVASNVFPYVESHVMRIPSAGDDQVGYLRDPDPPELA